MEGDGDPWGNCQVSFFGDWIDCCVTSMIEDTREGDTVGWDPGVDFSFRELEVCVTSTCTWTGGWPTP